ncbi:MAG: hypothetical protein C0605_09335 [Hyphomicrobiales bacterium]|nr:MAG: hypothetical protein C0605_09335 [Hyphomicrobiales bacterium]
MSEAAEFRLCPLEEMPDPGARGFEFGEGRERTELVAVRAGADAAVFINACPHQGTPLETFPDRFLTRSGTRLLCSTHGAEFRLEDGLCVKGPCKGKSLQKVDSRLEKGILIARLDRDPD